MDAIDFASRDCGQAADGQRPHFSNALEVPVHVNDTESMVQRRLSDDQIRDGSSVPHPVVVREVALELERALQDVGRRSHDLKVGMEVRLQLVIVSR